MSIDLIKQLREKTGISVAECKKALEGAGGDEMKALEILKEKSQSVTMKKAEAETKEGLIEAYIHSNGKIGVLVELNCQTDFVARNPDFKSLAKDLAMQVAATESVDVPSLLAEPFIKDPSRTVGSLINEHIAKLGENIKINKFARYQI